MALDLTSARASFQQYFMAEVCYLLRPRTLSASGSTYDDPAGPERLGPFPFGFSNVSGDEATDATIAVHGRYRGKLPIAMMPVPTEQDAIEYQGKTYQIVWAPPVTALALSRKLGLKE